MERRNSCILTLLAAATATLVLASCATRSAPKEEVRHSETVITQAIEAGAARHAPYELDLAQKKLALAKRWLGKTDPEVVGWLLEQAQVDAELAAAKAATATTF